MSLLFAATLAPRDFRWPIGITSSATSLLLLLIFRRVIGDPPHEFNPLGEISVALLVACVGLGVAHAIQARRRYPRKV